MNERVSLGVEKRSQILWARLMKAQKKRATQFTTIDGVSVSVLGVVHEDMEYTN
jgi:hypothetical protein